MVSVLVIPVLAARVSQQMAICVDLSVLVDKRTCNSKSQRLSRHRNEVTDANRLVSSRHSRKLFKSRLTKEKATCEEKNTYTCPGFVNREGYGQGEGGGNYIVCQIATYEQMAFVRCSSLVHFVRLDKQFCTVKQNYFQEITA